MLILSDFLGRSFCLSAKRRPSKPRTRKSDSSSDVLFDGSDFFDREARTTSRRRKSMRAITALRVLCLSLGLRLVSMLSAALGNVCQLHTGNHRHPRQPHQIWRRLQKGARKKVGLRATYAIPTRRIDPIVHVTL